MILFLSLCSSFIFIVWGLTQCFALLILDYQASAPMSSVCLRTSKPSPALLLSCNIWTASIKWVWNDAKCTRCFQFVQVVFTIQVGRCQLSSRGEKLVPQFGHFVQLRSSVWFIDRGFLVNPCTALPSRLTPIWAHSWPVGHYWPGFFFLPIFGPTISSRSNALCWINATFLTGPHQVLLGTIFSSPYPERSPLDGSLFQVSISDKILVLNYHEKFGGERFYNRGG